MGRRRKKKRRQLAQPYAVDGIDMEDDGEGWDVGFGKQKHKQRCRHYNDISHTKLRIQKKEHICEACPAPKRNAQAKEARRVAQIAAARKGICLNFFFSAGGCACCCFFFFFFFFFFFCIAGQPKKVAPL